MKIGIDLGGTKIELIALDKMNGSGEYNECYCKRVLTPQGDYQKTLELIVTLIEEAELILNKHASIGIGIPGTISLQTDLVKNANSVCLIGKPLKADLEQRLNRTIRINNDANCMTISEATDGVGKNSEVVFGVILGTGTGGGIAVNKKVLSGKNRIAGEWGHNPIPWQQTIDQPNMVCYCGKKNCIETFLSGPGLLKRYQYLGGKAENVEQLVAQQQAGSVLAQQALVNYENQLARSLASVINILDPDLIVLAGGLSNIKCLYQNIPKICSEYVFSDQITTKIVAAKHGDSSGVRGAAWLW